LPCARGVTASASIDRTTGGFILGAETAFDTAWRIGMAGAYTQTSFDPTGRLSSGRLDGYHAALYGSGALGGFNLRGGATFTFVHEFQNDCVRGTGFIPNISWRCSIA